MLASMHTSETATHPRFKWLHLAAAVFIAVVVVGVYAGALRAGRVPSGHPWAGIALGAVALQQGALFAGARKPLVLALSVLGAAAAVAWFVSAA